MQRLNEDVEHMKVCTPAVRIPRSCEEQAEAAFLALPAEDIEIDQAWMPLQSLNSSL